MQATENIWHFIPFQVRAVRSITIVFQGRNFSSALMFVLNFIAIAVIADTGQHGRIG
jgi:hypothetical protein